jgi:hypothetical protein
MITEPLQVLLAPWTYPTPVGRLFFVLQLVALVASLFRRPRRAMRETPWIGSILVGPPLLWALFEATLSMMWSDEPMGPNRILTCVSLYFPSVCVVGVTLVLQTALTIVLARDPRRSFPLLGIAAALLAILNCTLNQILIVTEFLP